MSWYRDNWRHALAARGIRSSFKAKKFSNPEYTSDADNYVIHKKFGIIIPSAKKFDIRSFEKLDKKELSPEDQIVKEEFRARQLKKAGKERAEIEARHIADKDSGYREKDKTLKYIMKRELEDAEEERVKAEASRKASDDKISKYITQKGESKEILWGNLLDPDIRLDEPSKKEGKDSGFYGEDIKYEEPKRRGPVPFEGIGVKRGRPRIMKLELVEDVGSNRGKSFAKQEIGKSKHKIEDEEAFEEYYKDIMEGENE